MWIGWVGTAPSDRCWSNQAIANYASLINSAKTALPTKARENHREQEQCCRRFYTVCNSKYLPNHIVVGPVRTDSLGKTLT